MGYRRAAHAILLHDRPVSAAKIPTVGPKSMTVVEEVLATGGSPTVEAAVLASGKSAEIEKSPPEKLPELCPVASDWDAVFTAAAESGVAIEIDGDPARQDLDFETAPGRSTAMPIRPRNSSMPTSRLPTLGWPAFRAIG